MDRVPTALAAGEGPDRTVEKLGISCPSPQGAQVSCMSLHAAPSIDLPTCICGVARSLAAHDLVSLEYSMSRALLPLTAYLAAISDAAIVPVTLDGISNIAVECLVPLRALAPSITQPECVIDQDLDAKNLNNQFAVFTVAFLRDCMKEACADTLGEACQRPPWKVSRTDLETWFDLCSPSTSPSVPSQWITDGFGTDGQQVISATKCRLHWKRPIRIPRLQLPLHPWQLEPPFQTVSRLTSQTTTLSICQHR